MTQPKSAVCAKWHLLINEVEMGIKERVLEQLSDGFVLLWERGYDFNPGGEDLEYPFRILNAKL